MIFVIPIPFMNSHSRMFFKIDVLKRPATLWQRDSSTGVKFAKLLRTSLIAEHLRWLLLLLQRRRVNSIWNGTESMSYVDPKIQDLVPTEIKESECLYAFKFKIKRLVPERCLFRIYKIYLGQWEFVLTKKTGFQWSDISILSFLSLYT